MSKGISMEFRPLDADHVRARIDWREQDVGGSALTIEVTVRNAKDGPKSEEELRTDACALAVRFARAFADTVEG